MRRKKGFTLLELMIVVIIIGLLAIVAIPQYFQAIRRTKQNDAQHNLRRIREIEMAANAATGAGTPPNDWMALGGSGEQDVNMEVDLDGDAVVDVSLSFSDGDYTYTLTDTPGDAGQVVASPEDAAAQLNTYTINLQTGNITEKVKK